MMLRRVSTGTMIKSINRTILSHMRKGLSTQDSTPLQWPIESKLLIGTDEISLESMIDRSNILWKCYCLPSITPPITIEYAEAQKGDEIMDFCIYHNLPEAFGIVSWESSHTILPFLYNQIEDNLKTKRKSPIVCDVGCGTGLVAAVALLYGAKRVIALDYNIFALSFARRTLQRNIALFPAHDTHEAIKLVQFDLSELSQALPHADIYTFSDILYTEQLARLVAQRIRGLLMVLSGKNSHCIVSDPKRTTAKFFLEELGFIEAVEILSESGQQSQLNHNIDNRPNNIYSATVNNIKLQWIQSYDRHIFQIASLSNE